MINASIFAYGIAENCALINSIIINYDNSETFSELIFRGKVIGCVAIDLDNTRYQLDQPISIFGLDTPLHEIINAGNRIRTSGLSVRFTYLKNVK